nr:hypothetical protein [Tanacetum cinerariifolium]
MAELLLEVKLPQALQTLCEKINKYIQEKKEENNIAEDQAAKVSSQYWNPPIYYDDDDDDEEYFIQVIELYKNSPIAITPILPTVEPKESLSVRDEHLSTIPEKESDKVIKSSVENLVPIPKESKELTDYKSECDMLVCDDSSFKNEALDDIVSIPSGKEIDHLGSSGVVGHHEDEFIKLILSWSLDDILNEDLYKNKVESIPLTFESEEHYFGSFVNPLLEETRFELASSMEIMHRAPYADMLSYNESKSGENRIYDVTNMISLLDNISSLKSLLFHKNMVSKELEDLFNSKSSQDDFVKSREMSSMGLTRATSLYVLRTLQISLEGLALPYEAAQLKEAESTIPLQLLGMKHTILIRDECQLPKMMNSNITWQDSQKKLTIGVVSPYAAQVASIQEKLAHKDEVDLPMQVIDEQMDIILSGKSSFIIGRSGTGKTNILTMNQPKLCYAVKQNVSHLTSSSSRDINHDNTDDIPSEFNDILDTFINVPVKYYPLVITFQKFLIMLDGTLGSLLFERFLKAKEGSNGGLKVREFSDGKLSYEGYCLLAKSRYSTLSKEKREIVYTLFEIYENMKRERGEFDLDCLKNGRYEGDQMDLVYIDEVQDLNCLKNGRYEGDQMDLVYIDEVQDLTQSVIYILYHYYTHSIDKLEPKIRLISGEALFLLGSSDDENAIVTIFSGNESGEDIVGFGAEQVILRHNVGKLAKASSLRASFYQMRGTNHEAFEGYLREAALMFESIGKLELSVTCYCDLEEYERAGKIYVSTCGKIDAATECFTLAGCYSKAVEAYAKGDQLSHCLLVCLKGKLFDEGLQYINYWKERDKDAKSMMKFVKDFGSMESKRLFLFSLGCLDDLLLLEEESCHFLMAAAMARS